MGAGDPLDLTLLDSRDTIRGFSVKSRTDGGSEQRWEVGSQLPCPLGLALQPPRAFGWHRASAVFSCDDRRCCGCFMNHRPVVQPE